MKAWFFGVSLLAACGGSVATAAKTAEQATTTGDCDAGACDVTGATDADALAFFKKYFPDLSPTSDGANVVLTSDGMPSHKSPYFDPADPRWEPFDTMGGTRWQNPNRIAAQNFTVKVPLHPVARGIAITSALVDHQAATSQDEYHGDPMGLCLDGVAMFHGVAAPGDDLAQEEHTFDTHEGHPQNTGVYHHHTASPGPLEVLKKQGIVTTTELGKAEVELFAVMCDGTLVLGCTELDGSVPDDKDFDGQNGHLHDISDGKTTYFTNRYHTHVCRSKFPGDPYAPEIQYYSSCGSPAPVGPHVH